MYVWLFISSVLTSQMQQLESKHKNELGANQKSQEKEMEQFRSNYEREQDRQRSRHKTEAEQRVGGCGYCCHDVTWYSLGQA